MDDEQFFSPLIGELSAQVGDVPVVALEAVIAELGRVEHRLHTALGEASGGEARECLEEVLGWAEGRRALLSRVMAAKNGRPSE